MRGDDVIRIHRLQIGDELADILRPAPISMAAGDATNPTPVARDACRRPILPRAKGFAGDRQKQGGLVIGVSSNVHGVRLAPSFR